MTRPNRTKFLSRAAAAGFLLLAGALMSHYRPGADSIGDVLHPSFMQAAP